MRKAISQDGAAVIADDFNQLVSPLPTMYDNGKIVGLRLAGAAARG